LQVLQQNLKPADTPVKPECIADFNVLKQIAMQINCKLRLDDVSYCQCYAIHLIMHIKFFMLMKRFLQWFLWRS